MNSDRIYFPEPEEIAPFAIAFATMMFAHAHFEAEVRHLQGAITCNPDFGEQRRNQWNARERPDRMFKLISEHTGTIPEAESIKSILTEAITPCDERNLLAHGQWWRFDPTSSTVDVRGGTQWQDDRVDHRKWTVADISGFAEKFKDLDAELYKLRREIEKRRSE